MVQDYKEVEEVIIMVSPSQFSCHCVSLWFQQRKSLNHTYCLILHQGPHLVKKQAEYMQADYMKDVKTHKPFDPYEGLASNFSIQYHPWIVHEGH